MFVKSFPFCCGGKMIVGLPDRDFEEHTKEFNRQKQKFVRKSLDEILPSLANNALVLIILNARQKRVFHTILKEYDFIIIRQKINPKTGSLLSLYSYTSPRFQLKGK